MLLNESQRKPRWQSRMDIAETLVKQDTERRQIKNKKQNSKQQTNKQSKQKQQSKKQQNTKN